MPSLYLSYEQIYSVLTAEITSKIGRLKSENYGEQDRPQLINDIKAKLEEADDLLEQLELECHGAGRAAASRVPAYRPELKRIKDEFKSVLNTAFTLDNLEDESFDEWTGNEQQRKLLDNSERLERTGKTLTDGYRVALETEQIGAAVLQDLSVQRETIQRSRSRLRETDEQLNRSSRLMNTMVMRALQDRFILTAVFVILAVLLCTGLYLYVT